MEPPEYLDDALVPIWRDVVATLPPARRLNPIHLEAYCAQIHSLRTASLDVQSFGVTIEDAQGRKVTNPALQVIRDMHGALAKWGNEFSPASTIKRRRGTMYDATRASVAAAKHLKDRKEYSGAVEAVCTLAWLIDEAQREGIETLQKAAFGTIPSYLKGCSELQITPASVPAAVTSTEEPKQSKKSKLQLLQGGA
jgi:P27 family predicted phage terminase small subunit